MRLDKLVLLGSAATLLVFTGKIGCYGYDSKKEECIKGQQRSLFLSGADLQKTLEAEFLPQGATIQLVVQLSLMIFETIGYGVAGKLAYLRTVF